MFDDQTTRLILISTILLFALAGLWWLAGWAAQARKSVSLIYVTFAVLALCIGLVLYGLFFAATLLDRPRIPLETVLLPLVIPLFLLLPPLLAFAVPQALLRADIPNRTAARIGFVISILALAAVPLGILIAGCGLAGVCM